MRKDGAKRMCRREREKYALRPARPEEIGEIFSLYEKRVHWMDEKGIRQWNDYDYLSVYPADYYREMQEKSRLYVLADAAAGKIASAVVLLPEDERWEEDEEKAAIYVHNLVADTTASGAGRALLTAVEALGRARGKRYMRLDCAADSVFLNDYYEALGYHAIGRCQDGPYVGVKRQKAL